MEGTITIDSESEIKNMVKIINEIIDKCSKLKGEEWIEIKEFGINKDLTLHIVKDSYYNPEIDVDKWNLVTIATKFDRVWVDDTENTYVTDGSLFRELERIYNYKDFSTL